MFGYVRIRKPELKVKDYELYRGFYCGLCGELKRQYGVLGSLTLTYDMTFLILLLSSVYDIPVRRKLERCVVHPAKKHWRLYNEVTEYAADMNILLSYYHWKDDREDASSKKAWLGMKLYHKKYRKAKKKYYAQEKEIVLALNRLSEMERQGEQDILKLAGCFGELMETLFDYRQDVFSGYLREFGYFLGRFIYIMDAYDDLLKDRENGSFNPFLAASGQEGFEEKVQELLLNEIAAAGNVFQKLPCLEYADILGNILYAGIWNRYDQIQAEKKGEIQEGKKE
ncbi:hypothetical protein D7V86_04810 [bacterium D16-51]|nr:hypothetical protein D7V96_05785 [bacterium D16-59]RKI61604.1 hypothetical protein D7V86_04810 [bacterium D16-51]